MDKFKTWPIRKQTLKEKSVRKTAYIQRAKFELKLKQEDQNKVKSPKALRVLQPLTSLYLGSVDLLQGVSFNMLAIP